MDALLDPAATAARLPPLGLADAVHAVLTDPEVQVPPRLVQALPGGGSLFVMPALDGRIAVTKLITFTPANAGTARPTIQGDVVVFDVRTGARLLVLDGPTVTARRTAAVSLLAARHLAPRDAGELMIIGAGAQGRAHLEAFAQGMHLTGVRVASRTQASAQSLVDQALALGLPAQVVTDPDAHVKDCAFVVTCTPADGVVLRATLPDHGFVAAVGAFTPRMVELAPQLCKDVATRGRIVVDTPDAAHEAGDLLQAGIDVGRLASLREALGDRPQRPERRTGPVLFKSCGWAGWDLAAARAALACAPAWQERR